MRHDDGAPSSRAKLVLAVFAVIGGFFLLVEHRAHVLPVLPWLLLAACPLMHLFMHGGHGHRRGHADHSGPDGGERRPVVSNPNASGDGPSVAAQNGPRSHGEHS